MNKKIIAILLVFTLVITCFVACKKQEYETTKINGKDVILATDENGNTIINEDNQIVAVVTDSEGEILTYENGENQTYNVQIVGSWVGDNFIQDKDYKLVIPEGWEGSIDGKVIKKDTDGKCYIQYTKVKELEKKETIETYLETIDQQNAQLIPGFEKEGYTLTVDKSITSFTDKGLRGDWYVYKIVDGDGKVVHYAENIYFVSDKTIYSVNYACVDGIGYDESFNFGEYLKTGFTFKG